MMRETLDPMDICTLSSTGRIEYLGFWKIFKSSLEQYLTMFPKIFFCRPGMFYSLLSVNVDVWQTNILTIVMQGSSVLQRYMHNPDV